MDDPNFKMRFSLAFRNALAGALPYNNVFRKRLKKACNALGTQYVFRRIKQDDRLGSVSTVQKWLGHLVRTNLDKTGTKYIRLFSVVFSLNIAVGNVSLSYVSVNFNQVMRSLVPVFTICMGVLVGRRFTWQRVMSVIPIVAGVAMACYGDMTYTKVGFFYTIACVIIASLKVTAAGEMLTGSLKLHPVDLVSMTINRFDKEYFASEISICLHY